MNTGNEGCRRWEFFFSFFLFFLRKLRHSRCKSETKSFTDDVNSCKLNFFLKKKVMAQEVEWFRQSGGSRLYDRPSGLGLLGHHDTAALTKCKKFSSAFSFLSLIH